MAILSAITALSSWGRFSIIGSLSLLIVVARAVYNRYFHPLAKVPGPFFASVSGIPAWYHALRGDRHIWLWQLNQIYGPRIRAEPNLVIFCDAASFNDINSNKANVKRSAFYVAMQKNHKERNTLTTVDPHMHAQRRKRLDVSFTAKSLKAISSFMVTHISRWVDIIAEECEKGEGGDDWTEPKDFSTLAAALVFDIMGDLCFGKSAEIKEPGENPFKTIPHSITQYLMFWYPVARSPILGLIFWLRPRGLDALMEMATPPEVKTYFKFVEDSMTKRAELQEELREKPETEQRLDMFHFIYEAKDPETGAPAYDRDQLFAETNMMIIAGSDTTTAALCGIFFYLARDQIRHDKLTSEIRSTFGTEDDIVPGPTLQSCTYLKACIDEGMRLAPSGPSELSREVRPRGITISGEFYPAGVVVGSAPWTQSRNEVYGDPYVFRPERWIVDEASGVTAESISAYRTNYNPFYRGPFSCPGRNMALLELMLAVARTLHRLDVRKAPGSTKGEGSREMQWGQRDPNILQMKDGYLSYIEGPMVQFRKRKV